MKCPQCGKENPVQQEICVACGARVALTCPRCQALIPCQDTHGGACVDDPVIRGRFRVDNTGLVLDVNPAGAAVLGLDRTAIVHKPFSLFVPRDYLATFFSHRNALLASGETQSCEIKLKREDRLVPIRMTCRLETPDGDGKPLMEVIAEDITETRRALDRLQYRRDIDGLIAAFTAEMIRAPMREIDYTIQETLRNIGILAELDRCEVCRIGGGRVGCRTRHQWRSDSAGRAVALKFSAVRIAHTLTALKSRQPLIVADAARASDVLRREASVFGPPSLRAWVCLPLTEGRQIVGLLRAGRVKAVTEWPKEIVRLLDAAAPALALFTVRQKDELSWIEKRKRALRTVGRPSAAIARAEPADPEVYDGPIHIELDAAEIEADAAEIEADATEIEANAAEIETDADADEIEAPVDARPEDFVQTAVIQTETSYAPIDLDPGPVELEIEPIEGDAEPDPIPEAIVSASETWVVRKAVPLEASQVIKLHGQDNTFLASCPKCSRQKEIVVSGLEGGGQTFMLRCSCEFTFFVEVELRAAVRKAVNLAGHITRVGIDRIIADSISGWGRVRIRNVSRNGVGFVSVDLEDIKPGDFFMILFQLDTDARTEINRRIVVRLRKGRYVGAQFTDTDKSDVTLGFYTMK